MAASTTSPRAVAAAITPNSGSPEAKFRAINRVDHERKIGAADRIEQAIVPRGCLLANDDRSRIGSRESAGDDQLSRVVRVCDDIEAGRLLAHLSGEKPAEPRHDLGLGGPGKDLAQSKGIINRVGA
jgi:hypothetical protein